MIKTERTMSALAMLKDEVGQAIGQKVEALINKEIEKRTIRVSPEQYQGVLDVLDGKKSLGNTHKQFYVVCRKWIQENTNIEGLFRKYLAMQMNGGSSGIAPEYHPATEKCDLCGAAFESERSLIMHKRRAHGDLSEKPGRGRKRRATVDVSDLLGDEEEA